MMTPTRGCLWENPDCVLGTAGAGLRVRFRGWRYMSHFATLAALRLAVQVYARTRHNKSKLFKFRDLRHVIRGGKEIEHRGGGNFESSRANGEREDGAEVVFVLEVSHASVV